MIVNNFRKNMKCNFYSPAPSGGGAWEMDLDPDAMAEAASAYEKAAGQYNSALQKLIGALQELSGAWEGTAASAWKESTDSLQKKLEAVGVTLDGNKNNVNKISAKINEIESEMNTNVSTI